MNFENSKQYNFTCQFEFPNDVNKELACSAFLLNGNIYILSFFEGKKFTKHIYNNQTSFLLGFENYRHDIITFGGEAVNELTEIYSRALKYSHIRKEFNLDLTDKFGLNINNYSVKRTELRYSFLEHEARNQGKDNKQLYKNVEFFSSYAKDFSLYENKQYLNLDLFKDNNTYWYCISNSSGIPVCKFVFKFSPEEEVFKLIQRENYIDKANIVEFNILKEHFQNLTNTSEHMHFDIADERIPYLTSCTFGFLPKLFNNETTPLPFLI